MKISKRAKIITNALITAVVLIVALISFMPQKIVPIYNGESLEAIYNGNRSKKQVSIMINVYENALIVEQMLDILAQKNAKATFFVGGCWADDNGETLEKIVSCGHEIGNHGYFHKDHKKISYEDNFSEISLTGKIVSALSGITPTLFAPPSGSYSKETLKAASNLGYKVIMWSKDTIDWRDKDENLIFNRATKNISNGDLILMHPKAHTVNVLGKILDYYTQMGFSAVSVSENIK